ncbi:MAG: GNAT family N-acetyltransferase [Nanoarchaeota archaeon]
MIYERHPEKYNILNIAVHPDHRRNGVGTKMIEELIQEPSLIKRTSIYLEVKESNLKAQLFF